MSLSLVECLHVHLNNCTFCLLSYKMLFHDHPYDSNEMKSIGCSNRGDLKSEGELSVPV